MYSSFFSFSLGIHASVLYCSPRYFPIMSDWKLSVIGFLIMYTAALQA